MKICKALRIVLFASFVLIGGMWSQNASISEAGVTLGPAGGGSSTVESSKPTEKKATVSKPASETESDSAPTSKKAKASKPGVKPSNAVESQKAGSNMPPLSKAEYKVTLDSPNGGEHLMAGATNLIKFRYSGPIPAKVSFFLFENNKKLGLIKIVPINRKTFIPFTFTWKVGEYSKGGQKQFQADPGRHFRIKAMVVGTKVEDMSNSVFTISPKLDTMGPTMVTVVTPNGGEAWHSGETQTIVYHYTGPASAIIRLDLYKDGQKIGDIHTNNSPSQGSNSYNWAVGKTTSGSAEPGDHYQIEAKIVGQGISDLSDNTFTILRRFTVGRQEYGDIAPKWDKKNPEINFLSYSPSDKLLKPGSVLNIGGKHFGSDPGKMGKIIMCGQFNGSCVNLETLDWKDTFVMGKIPMSTNGVPNHEVTIRVIADNPEPDGMFDVSNVSNKRTLIFFGREEWLLTSDSVKVIQCPWEKEYDQCNQKVWTNSSMYDRRSDETCSKEDALCGIHENDTGIDEGENAGADIFDITLKYGWVFKSASFKYHTSSSDEFINDPTDEFPVGGTHWVPKIIWRVSVGDYLYYKFKIIVDRPWPE